MNDQERWAARVAALSDQRWMQWDEHWETLERIARRGPANDQEAELACRALLFFAGELARRQVARQKGESA